MNIYEQQLRINRALFEKMELLDVKHIVNKKEFIFYICSSSGTMYTIKINDDISCNCPDFLTLTKDTYCKHICYTLIKLLSYDKDFIINPINCGEIDIENNLDTIKQKINMESIPYQKYKQLRYFNNVNMRGDCIICYETKQLEYECTQCQQLICNECYTMWFKNNNTCPYCRSKIVKNNVYLNLFS